MGEAGTSVHKLTRREIHAFVCERQREGALFDPARADLLDVFKGSLDRFCEIADRLRACRSVLDVGAGHGILLALLHELGHECHGVDVVDQTAAYAGV